MQKLEVNDIKEKFLLLEESREKSALLSKIINATVPWIFDRKEKEDRNCNTSSLIGTLGYLLAYNEIDAETAKKIADWLIETDSKISGKYCKKLYELLNNSGIITEFEKISLLKFVEAVELDTCVTLANKYVEYFSDIEKANELKAQKAENALKELQNRC